MEPKICSVLDCGSRSDQGDPEIYFYGFPRKPKYRKVWVAVTGRKQWTAKRSSRICSKHFLPACFAEGEGKSLLEDVVPTELIKTATPESPLQSLTPLDTVLSEQNLEPDEIDELADWSESEVVNFIKTVDFDKPLRTSTPLGTDFSEQYLEPDEIDESAEWSEPGLNYSLKMRNPSEDQADPSMIVLRSTASVAVPGPGTSSTVTETEIQKELSTTSVVTPPQSSTNEVTSPPEELTATFPVESPTRTATPERHSAPTPTKSVTSSKKGSGSSILPPWVRIASEHPARNPKEAGSTFRKKLLAFLRCPNNPLDIESDLQTLFALGVHIFILRRGNIRSVVNSLFRYIMKT